MITQPGLCQTWLETPKTGFLTTRLISYAGFFKKVWDTLDLYNLPTIRQLLETNSSPTKLEWKHQTRQGLSAYWTASLVVAAQKKTTLSNCVSSLTYKLDKPSIYLNLSLIALMCLLCHLESKDLQHFILHCPAHESTTCTFQWRTQDISFWFVTC